MSRRLIQLLADNRQNPSRRFEARVVRNDAGEEEAEVFLYDVIVNDELEAEWWGGIAPETFVKVLRAIDAQVLHLRVNSPGGSVFGARAIEQALREHKARVVAHIDGLAASAASFVVMAADDIVIGKGAMMMIHKAWSLAIGNADDMRSTADLLDKLDGTLVQTYADRTGQAPEAIGEWMAAETWFTAAEAVELGFADRLADEPADAEARATTWNLMALLRDGQRRAPAARVQTPAPSPAASPAPSATDDHRARQAQRLRALSMTQIV